MSSRFYFGDSGSESEIDDNDPSTLPFPKPLAREAFLTPTFDAAEFLSNLSTRFQTLEDLQTELRELSQSLNKELVDLVNDNYQDCLSLGGTLKGGDEKIEDIRVGLLGFQRDVAALKAKIDQRRQEVMVLLGEKRRVLKEAEKGRALLEIAERTEDLEEQLGIAKAKHNTANGAGGGGADQTNASESEDEDPEDDEDDAAVPAKTRRRVEQYLILKLLMSRHNPDHPFLLSLRTRSDEIKATLLLDLQAPGDSIAQMRQRVAQS